MEQDPRKRILTIPNLVSLARLLGVGWFLWLLLVQDRVLMAAIVFIVIGTTDWVDGTLARALDQESELGRLLDPIADRLALASAVVGGAIAGVVPLPITAILVLREAVMLASAAWLLARTGQTLHVRWLGKAATATLYAAIPAFYLHGAGLGNGEWWRTGWVLGVIGLAVYLWVAGGYLAEIRTRSRVAGTKEVAE